MDRNSFRGHVQCGKKNFRSTIFSVVCMRTNNINNRQGDQTILAQNERNREIKEQELIFYVQLCSICYIYQSIYTRRYYNMCR